MSEEGNTALELPVLTREKLALVMKFGNAVATNDRSSLAAIATEAASTPYASDAKQFTLVGAEQGLWAPLEPITYAVGGIIPVGSVTLLAGYSSSLKSWVAAQMACAVGSGHPWLGHAPFATERGAVTYMDREAGLYEMRRRLHAIRRPFGVIDDPLLDVCSFPADGNVFNPEFRKKLAELCHKRKLIALDTLAAFAFGGDENSAQMAEGVGSLKEANAGTDCAIVVVAHEKKKGKDGGDADPRERVRGSSSIFGAVDVVFSLQRPGPREPVTVEHTKARGGREIEPFTVTMLDAPGGGVTFEVSTISEPHETAKEKNEVVMGAIVECIRQNAQCSTEAVRLEIGIRKSTLIDMLKVAEERGRIRNLGTEKAAKWVVR